jgi:hypothetical protein
VQNRTDRVQHREGFNDLVMTRPVGLDLPAVHVLTLLEQDPAGHGEKEGRVVDLIRRFDPGRHGASRLVELPQNARGGACGWARRRLRHQDNWKEDPRERNK